MKTLLIALAFLMTGYQGMATESSEDSDCSRLLHFSGLTLAESIEADLLSGSWTYKVQDHDRMIRLEFYPNGIARKIEIPDRPQVTHLLWSTSVLEDKAWLILQDERGDKQYLRLDQHCAGIAAYDIVNEENLFWDVDATMDEFDYSLKLARLYGKWTSGNNPFQFDREMHDCTEHANLSEVKLEWEFKKDGYFSLQIESDGQVDEATGIWELTQDGKYLSLQFLKDGDAEQPYLNTIVRVGSLSNEDVVFYQNDLPEQFDFQFCEEWKAVHYQRI